MVSTPFEWVGVIDILSTDFHINPDSGFGAGLEFVIDLDQDGFDDSAVGTPYDDRIDLFDSNGGGIFSTVFGNNGELFGFALGRHTSGLLIGAPGGKPGGQFASNGRVVLMDPVSLNFLLDIQGTANEGRFGWDVAAIEDFDGDGEQELVIGAPGVDAAVTGSVWIYMTNGGQLTEIAGLGVGERFGFAVDVCDHDGDEDIVVGVPHSLDPNQSFEVGRVDVFDRNGNLHSRQYGTDPNGEFGASVSCGQDADGDAIDDLLVGAPRAEIFAVPNSGRAFLYNFQQTLLAQWAGTDGEKLGRNVLIARGQNNDSMGDLVISDAYGGDGRGTSRVYRSDRDADDVDPNVDNCPLAANPTQDDTDGDGFGDACDCDADDPLVYPGAPELLDGKDNQCPGDDGNSHVDEYIGLLTLININGTTIQWTDATPGDPNDLYELARAGEPTFFSNCDLTRTASTSVLEIDDPLPGEVFFYLLRHGEPYFGSWGETSKDGPRWVSCTP